MRILFVTPYIPSPIRVRPYQIIRALAGGGHHIHLVALQPPEDRWAIPGALPELCARVDLFPISRAATLWNGLRALPRRLPLQAAYSHHRVMEERVRQLAQENEWDVLHVEHLRGAVLASRVGNLPRVFDAVDSIALLFAQAARQAPRWSQRLMAAADLGRTRRFEARLPYEYERILVTSPLDRQEFVRLAGPAAAESIVVVPNGVDTEFFSPAESCPTLPTILFTGKMSYHANAAAAIALARDIMPAVWAARPDTRLVIAGKSPPPGVAALASDPRVTVTGYVDDLSRWFAEATLVAAPMRYGVGIQNKILEAMASGVAVVTTSQATRSLQARADRDYLVGDTPETFARQILRLLDNGNLRSRVAASGRSYVERHHTWQSVRERLLTVYGEAREAWLRNGGQRRRSQEP